MPTLRGLVYAFTAAEIPWLTAALSLTVLLAVIRIARRSDLEFSLALALVGGLLIGYHAYLQDCAILLLVFVLVLEHSRSAVLRAATGLALTPPLYLALVAGRPWNAALPLVLMALVAMAAHSRASSSADVGLPPFTPASKSGTLKAIRSEPSGG